MLRNPKTHVSNLPCTVVFCGVAVECILCSVVLLS